MKKEKRKTEAPNTIGIQTELEGKSEVKRERENLETGRGWGGEGRSGEAFGQSQCRSLPPPP